MQEPFCCLTLVPYAMASRILPMALKYFVESDNGRDINMRVVGLLSEVISEIFRCL